MPDATFDQNRYALTLELQLNTDPAFKSLDRLGEKAEELERKIAEVAQSSFDTITESVENISRAMEGIAEKFTQATTGTKQMVPLLLKQQGIVEDMFDKFTIEAKDRKKGHDSELQTIKALDTINRAWAQEGELVKDFMDLMLKVVDAVGDKNKGHEEQISLLTKDNKLIQEQRNIVEHNNHGWREGLGLARGLWRELIGISAAYNLINQDVEHFRTANYRAYGSQQQIVQQTADLTTQTGLLRDETIEAYKVLGNLKVPREELGKYAEVVGMTSRVTGVGMEQLGDYIQRIRSVGLGTNESTRQLTWMTEAMRKLGLNTNDMNRALQNSGTSAQTMSMIFKEGKDAPLMFDRMKASAMGFGKAIGMNSEQVSDLAKAMENTTSPDGIAAMSQWAEAAGLPGDQLVSVEDYNKAIIGIGRDIDNNIRGMTDLAEIQGTLKAMAGQYGLANEQLAQSFREMYLQTEAGTDAAKVFRDFNMVLSDHEKAQAALKQQYRDSTATVVRQSEEMWAKISAIFVKVQFWVEGFIGPIISAITPIIGIIGGVVDAIDNFVRTADSAIAAATGIGGVMRFLVGAAVMAVPAFIAVAGAMRIMHTMFGGFTGSLGRGSRVIVSFGQFAVSVFRAVGESFEALIVPVGRGLSSLGASVTPVIPALLSLGAAFLMTGAGAWMFAQAVSTVAGAGWSTMPALVGMLGALAAVAGGLIAFAGPAMAVAPGIIALGAGLLMAGGATWLFGSGMLLAAQAVQTVVTSLRGGIPIWEMLSLTAVGVGALAAAAFFGAGPIIALGSGLLMVAAAGAVVIAGLAAIAATVRSISGVFQTIVGVVAGATTSFSGLMGTLGQGILVVGGVVTVAWAFALALGVLGPALLVFGGLIAPVTTSLIAFGAVLSLVGLSSVLISSGMWLASQAFSVATTAIGALGPHLFQVAAGMLAVSVASIAFGVALGGMATVGFFATAPLTALGLALIPLGAGIALVGGGMWLFSQAMRVLGQTSLWLLPIIVGLSAGIVAFAVIITPFSAALSALAVAAGLAAGPLAVFGLALVPLALGLWTVSMAAGAMSGVIVALFTGLSAVAPQLYKVSTGMVVMAAASLGFVAALGALGAVGYFAAGPLAAIGAAMIPLGAAAFMVGAGLALAASAFWLVVDAIGPHSPPMWEKLVLITTGLAALAATAFFATGPIFALGAGLGVAAAAAWILVKAFGPIESLMKPMAAIGSGVSAVSAGIGDVAGSVNSITGAAPALNSLSVALTASLPVATAAGQAWGGFATVFSDISNSVDNVSVKVGRLVGSMASLGTKLGSAFRDASAGSVDLSGVVKQAGGIDTAFTTLGMAADKLTGVQHTATNIDVAIRHLSESGGRLKGIKEIFAEFSGALLFLVDSISNNAVSKMDRVSSAMQGFAASLNGFASSLRDTMVTISGVSGPAFGTVMDSLTGFTGAFERALSVLAGSNLAAVLDAQLVGLQASVESMAGLLNQYADLLENAAVRVETAIMTRAVPAMIHARDSGVVDTVRAETISTVLVRDKEESATTDVTPEVQAIKELNNMVRLVLDAIISGTETSDVIRRRIAEVLEKHLPEIGDHPVQGSLASNMNNWSN